jgi:hypothetical protein
VPFFSGRNSNFFSFAWAMAQRSETVAVRLSWIGCVMFIGRVKLSASPQVPEIEGDKFSFSWSPRLASGPQMHIQSLHAQRQREPLLTVIISCMRKLFL